jgi:peptide/nickel transport system permease protein
MRSWWRSNPRLQIGVLLLAPFLVAAAIPGTIAPYNPTDLVDVPFEHPSSQYWLGTDEIGRDIFSRLVFAARTDLKISLGATLIAAAIGVTVGLWVGYRGGLVSGLSLRVTDVMLAFPSILLALFLVAVVGPSDLIVIAALTILYIPGFLRFARAMALSLRERAFVEASVIAGARAPYVMWRHLLPNAIGPILVGIALTAAYTLLAAATLSYLGLGTPPPAPSWGNMLQASFNTLFQDWRYGIWPGLCIVVVALGYMLVSEGIEVAVQRSGSAGAGAAAVEPTGATAVTPTATTDGAAS